MTSAPADRVLVLANPAAGGGRALTRLKAPLATLRRAGWTLDVVASGGPGELTRAAADAWQAGQRAFVAAGGDGTTWEVVQGLMEARAPGEPTPWLGVLPVGTGNSFLRDRGIQRLPQAIEALLAGHRQAVDVGRLDTRDRGPIWSLNLVSVGFVADICARANARFKWAGPAGYVLGLLGELARLRSGTIGLQAAGDEPRELATTFVCWCNSQYTGGAMHMAPGARIDDGAGDLIVLGPMARGALLAAFPRIYRGTHLALAEVAHARSSGWRIALDGPCAVMVDGEVLRAWPTAWTCEAAALQMCLPPLPPHPP
jgi:YegS/Rv2252/BmrU family lipid kinase